MRYNLHAILIHEGSATSGHYYSYIFDRKQNLWWKFSDANVSMEGEDVVFAEAFGGQEGSTRTAYSIIYANHYCEAMIDADPVSTFRMGQYLETPLRDSVQIENVSFL